MDLVMRGKKHMRESSPRLILKRFGTLVFMSSFTVLLSLAQVKTFVREYTYNAGEADSKITSRSIALEQVKRLLLEEVGVYIQSRFEMATWERLVGTGSELAESTQTKTQAVTAGITETIILEERWTGDKYYIRAQIVVDTADVVQKVQAIAEDEDRLAQLEDSRKKADEELVEIKRLQAELKRAKSEAEKSKSREEYSTETNRLSAHEWFERGIAKGQLQNYRGALKDFNKAIELNPDFAQAYNTRGWAKRGLHNYKGALEDFDKAIRLKPNHARAYNNRGATKLDLKDYNGAMEDFNKAIEL